MYKFFKIVVFIIFNFLFFNQLSFSSEEKIKIGLLVPLTGEDKQIGNQIVKSTRIALKDINSNKIEIYPKDTASDPTQALNSAKEFKQMGINIIIGPVFHKSLIYLDEVEDLTFISLTNKTIDLPKNVISAGVNASSQLEAIKKFIELNKIKKTIFLTPKLNYEAEINKAIKQSKIKISKHHFYDTEPTKLTKQIEKITNYKIRKQNVTYEIKRIKNSDLSEADKERRINKLKQCM